MNCLTSLMIQLQKVNMNTSEITTLLHHRTPYLMVDEVLEHSNKKIKAVKNFKDEKFLEGHFPGRPIVPGAMIQEFCTQSAGILLTKYYSPVENYNSETTKGHAIGVLRKVTKAKYMDFVDPSVPLQCSVKLTEAHDHKFEFKAKVYQDGEVKAKLQFELINISDDKLGSHKKKEHKD